MFVVPLPTLEDGSFRAGILKRETDDLLVLEDTERKEVTVQKSNVATRSQPVSDMPPMGGLLTRRELRDLVEYLSSLK